MRVFKNATGLTAGLMVGVAVLSFTGCTNEDDAKLSDSKLSDAKIASIAVTANQIDVDYGKIALEKETDPKVIKFAQTMIDDHQKIIDDAVDLVGKLGVTPDDNNEVTKSLLEGAKAMKDTLKTLEGRAFSKAYISNEVKYHEAVIKTVRETLIPQVENEELKATLENVLPLLDNHLVMAKATKESVDNRPDIPILIDAQIASAAVTANQIDVDYGKIALKKSKNADVTKFAQTMVDDHAEIIKSAVALAGKLGVIPDNDNPVTTSLIEGSEKMKTKLNELSDDAFNKAYIDNEVTYHEAVISAVKEVLIPQTENEELEDMLISVLPLLEHHLEMAKEAQAKLSK